MMPTLALGDRILVSSIPYLFFKPKKGDIIAFRYNGKTMIKRITHESNGKYFLEGDNKGDSLKTEPIRKKEILGKVVTK